MILLGDISDRALSSTSQIITQTNAFIQTLGSIADIKKGIYIPGNHDHTQWTSYVKKHSGPNVTFRITPPEGDLIVKDGVPCSLASSNHYLSLFFGYPFGSSWREIDKNKEFGFSIANPIYATRFKDRTYVFTHGTHFRKDVTAPLWMKKIFDYSQLDRIFGNFELISGGDVSKAKNLEMLEKMISPFVDSLWQSSKNHPTPRSDKVWYFITSLSGKFGKKRQSFNNDVLFSYGNLKSQNAVGRIVQLSDENESIKRYKEFFQNHMLKYLEDKNLPRDHLTFVYGDTHDGGWGEFDITYNSELTHNSESINMRIYNTGGWVVHNAEDHPPCHLFAVDEDGTEYLLDLTFKTVKVDGDSLLKLTTADAENRYGNLSGITRFLIDQLNIG